MPLRCLYGLPCVLAFALSAAGAAGAATECAASTCVGADHGEAEDMGLVQLRRSTQEPTPPMKPPTMAPTRAPPLPTQAPPVPTEAPPVPTVGPSGQFYCAFHGKCTHSDGSPPSSSKVIDWVDTESQCQAACDEMGTDCHAFTFAGGKCTATKDWQVTGAVVDGNIEKTPSHCYVKRPNGQQCTELKIPTPYPTPPMKPPTMAPTLAPPLPTKAPVLPTEAPPLPTLPIAATTPEPKPCNKPPSYWCGKLCGKGFGFFHPFLATCEELCSKQFPAVVSAMHGYCEHGVCKVGHTHHCTKPCDQCEELCEAIGLEGAQLHDCKKTCTGAFYKHVQCTLDDYCEAC